MIQIHFAPDVNFAAAQSSSKKPSFITNAASHAVCSGYLSGAAILKKKFLEIAVISFY